MGKIDRQSQPMFSIGIVIELTGLTARQIRYYEAQHLIFPTRTKGNTRRFSFNDIDRLLEIKELIKKGINLAGVKQLLHVTPVKSSTSCRAEKKEEVLSDRALRRYLRRELNYTGEFGKSSIRQGELSRFFKY